MAEISRRDTVPEDHRLPAAAGPNGVALDGRFSDPDELRREIERTRARMTRTLDELEGRLVRGKEELVARVTFRDVRQRLSAEPWRTLAVAFVVGYVVAAIRD